MTDNTWILGADIGQSFVKISCCRNDQTELTNENGLFQDDFSQENVYLKLKNVIESLEQTKKEKIKIVFSCDDGQIGMVKAVEKRLVDEGFLKENLRMISQENAFIHYVLNQEEGIRKHSVL